MKRVWAVVALAGSVWAGSFGSAQAYDYWSLVKDKTVVVVSTYTFTTAITSTATVLVDLSDTTLYPHKSGTVGKAPRQLNVSSIRASWDSDASTQSLRLGVVTYISASTGSVTWFYHSSNISNAGVGVAAKDTGVTQEYFYKLRVDPLVPVSITDGSTPFLLSNAKTSGTTVYQSDVALVAPSGFVFPNVGDIVMEVEKDSTKTVSLVVEVGYHAE